MGQFDFSKWSREQLVAHLEVHGCEPHCYGGENLVAAEDSWDKFSKGQLVTLATNVAYWLGAAHGPV